MLKLLHVGDVHAEPHDLADCAALMGFVSEVAEQERPDHLVLMGDQYHTHSLIHVEVLQFWTSVLEGFKKQGQKVIALVGNHDQSGKDDGAHAMIAHRNGAIVVDGPKVLEGILFLPHMTNREAFVEICQKYRPPHADEWVEWHNYPEIHCVAKSLVCHQTFEGSKYENGFYAQDGIDPNLVPQESIVSGHIHTPQILGKVHYLGASRWRTLSDANTDRAIWLITYSDDGSVVERKPFAVGVCRKIRHLVDTPETPVEGPFDPKDQWRIDIKGTAEYVEARRKALAAPGIRIRTFPTQVSVEGQIRESEGIGPAFWKYLARFSSSHGSVDALTQLVKERIGAF